MGATRPEAGNTQNKGSQSAVITLPVCEPLSLIPTRDASPPLEVALSGSAWCLRWELVLLVCYRCTTLNICLVILPAPCTFWRNALVIIAFWCVGNGRFCVHTCLHNMLVCTPRRSRVYGCARALCVYREVDFSVAPITFSTSLCCDT